MNGKNGYGRTTASREVRRVVFFYDDIAPAEEGDLFETPEELLAHLINSGIEVGIDTTDYPVLYIEFSAAQIAMMTYHSSWIGSDECWGPWLCRYYRHGRVVGEQTEVQLSAWWEAEVARRFSSKDDESTQGVEVLQRYFDALDAYWAQRPEERAALAEQEVLDRDPQQQALFPYKNGFEDGAIWDTEEGETLVTYVAPPIQTLPEDIGDAYEHGFIAGYRAQHPSATQDEAKDAYLWRIFGYDADRGRTRTREERDAAIEEARRKKQLREQLRGQRGGR